MMEPVEDILKMYPRTAAHLMCEGGLDSVSPAEAAIVIWNAKYPQIHYEEWIERLYGGDPIQAVSSSFKNRHSHREKDYLLARNSVELTIEGTLKIYVTEITHEHGNNICLNRTYEGALKNLDSYVKENWDSLADLEGNVPPLPQDIGERIDKYFKSFFEFYSITKLEVGE